jgi:hypothetical protein
MNKRPRSITVISWVFIALGGIALLNRLLPLVDDAAAGRFPELRAERSFEYWPICLLHVLAIVCGMFMLYGFNWARWLLVVWIGYHVVLSIFHSPFELFVHSLLFAIILYFLFRPQASAYFLGARALQFESPHADDA